MSAQPLDIAEDTAPAVQASRVHLSELPAVPQAGALLASRSFDGTKRNPLLQVKATLTVCVGSMDLTVGELMSAREEQVLRLNQAIDQPVDLLLEGQVVARGMLVVVDNCFGVRLTELPQPLKP